jgi:esterase/lipase
MGYETRKRRKFMVHTGMIKKILFGFIIVLLVNSCVTFDHKNPYPNMEIVRYGNSQAYVFRNSLSDKLIINIEGSGWDSVLGIRNERRWLQTRQGAQLLQELGERYSFLIPEKLNRQPGMEYSKEINDRSNYTAEKILDCYIESINGYLNEHSFSSIILIGSSEGAILLPLIYQRIDMKDSVTVMVSISFGGYSLYESYRILSESPKVPRKFKDMYNHILEVYEYVEDYKAENGEINITPEEDFYGLNYRWFDSFMKIRPFDYYKEINIPILFTHGEKDYNVPVESTLYIQKNLHEKPFEYIYYKWRHQPTNYFDTINFRKNISEWIIKKDK